MSRKLLAVIDVDADGTVHVTAIELEPGNARGPVAAYIREAVPRRELTWFPTLHNWKIGFTRDVTWHAQRVPHVDAQPISIHSPDLGEALRWLAGDENARRPR